MSYIVVYLRADGSSGVEECADLDLAVVAAERLRNVDSVERPRIFKTEEVTYDFKPYYRVEVTTADDASAGDDWVGHSDDAVATPAAAAAVPTPEPAPEPAAEVVQEPAPATEPEVAETAADVVEEVLAEEQPPAPVAAPAADQDAPSKKGLFSDSMPEPTIETPDASQLAEDVKDSVPPRRGLFGR